MEEGGKGFLVGGNVGEVGIRGCRRGFRVCSVYWFVGVVRERVGRFFGF